MAAHSRCRFPWSQTDLLAAFTNGFDQLIRYLPYRYRQQNRHTDLINVFENAKLYGQASRTANPVARTYIPRKNNGAGDDYDRLGIGHNSSSTNGINHGFHQVPTAETIPRNALYTRLVAPAPVEKKELTPKVILTRLGWTKPILGERKAQRRIRDTNYLEGVICWTCYLVGKHLATECPFKDGRAKRSAHMMVKFRSLTIKQQHRVPYGSFRRAKEYCTCFHLKFRKTRCEQRKSTELSNCSKMLRRMESRPREK